MRTFLSIRDCVKLDSSVRRIFLSLDNITVFKQFKCEGIFCKFFSFQTFSELELNLCCSWCEGVVKLFVLWKCCYSCKCMTRFRYRNCHVSFHGVVSHSSFFSFWDNFLYSVLMISNLSISEC